MRGFNERLALALFLIVGVTEALRHDDDCYFRSEESFIVAKGRSVPVSGTGQTGARHRAKRAVGMINMDTTHEAGPESTSNNVWVPSSTSSSAEPTRAPAETTAAPQEDGTTLAGETTSKDTAPDAASTVSITAEKTTIIPAETTAASQEDETTLAAETTSKDTAPDSATTVPITEENTDAVAGPEITSGNVGMTSPNAAAEETSKPSKDTSTVAATTIPATTEEVCPLSCDQRCEKRNGTFVCTCESGYELLNDTRCVEACPLSCDHGCEKRNGTFVCTCESGYELLNDTHCSEVCPLSCDHRCEKRNGTFVCTCESGYELQNDTHCADIDECKTGGHVCQQVCENTDGSYRCGCWGGYRPVTSVSCENIDECDEMLADCDHICEDVPGSYNCSCFPGYHLTDDNKCVTERSCDELNCEHFCIEENGHDVCKCKYGYELFEDSKCKDINECADNRTNACSHICQNREPGYTCACPAGMKLEPDGRTCKDCDPLFWGLNCANSCLQCDLDHTKECNRVTGCVCYEGWTGNNCQTRVTTPGPTTTTSTTTTPVPTTEAPEDVMYPWTPDFVDKELKIKKTWSSSQKITVPLFCEGHKKIYVSSMGFLSFDKKRTASPYDFPGRYQKKYKRKIVAPFLSYTETCKDSRVLLGHFRSKDKASESKYILDRANKDIADFDWVHTFRGTDVVVFTWYGMTASPWNAFFHSCHPYFGVTYQTVLVSDGIKTYAIMNYDTVGFAAWPHGDLIRFGYEYEDKTQQPMISGTYMMSFIDQLTGNAGRKGRWIFRLFDITPGASLQCYSPETDCLNWLSSARNGAEIARYLPTCPCNSMWAWLDRRFRLISSDKYNHCYRGRQQVYVTYSDGDSYYVQQHCCYKKRRSWWGGPLNTGRSSKYIPGRLTYIGHSPPDSYGYNVCCQESRRFCDLFYQVRPINKCRGYRPPRPSWNLGDPHVRTLDGLSYTFNGIGEYTLIKPAAVSGEGLAVQARTARYTNENGEKSNGTVFTAFCLKDNNTDTFQVQLNAEQNGLELYVNHTKSDFMDDEDEEREFSFASVSKNGTSQLSVVFSSGWAFSIQVGVKSVSIETSAPEEGADGSTRGLLGVFNGNQDDDLTAPDGTSIPSTSSEETIFHQFGQLWATDNSSSMFWYPPGTSWADFNDPSYVPSFNPCGTPDKQAEAEAFCGDNTACVFDYCATNDETFAGETKREDEEFVEMDELRSNNPPNISVSMETINATVNQTVELEVVYSDVDGDNVTIEVDTNIDENSYDLDLTTGLFTWRPDDMTPVHISFTATDTHDASSSVDTTVHLCGGCSGPAGGECDFSLVTFTSNISTFGEVECDCNFGYEGEECENLIDGCADNPCEEMGTNCTRVTPDELATGTYTRTYKCECGVGFEEVDSVCVDINECNTTAVPAPCHQVCENIRGSYRCSCFDGYRMDNDTCENINECQEGSDTCEHICTDTQGGYNCSCHPPYTLTDNNKCVMQGNTTCDLDCEHICTGNGTDFACTCRSGYELFNTTHCRDIDECKDGHHCEQNCINTPGGYDCSCNPGYQLAQDIRKCVECEALYYGENCANQCSCDPVGTDRCDKVEGCICKDGWTGTNCQTLAQVTTAAAVTTRKAETTTVTLTTMSTTQLPQHADGLTIKLKLQKVWEPEFADTSTEAYQRLVDQLHDLFDWVYKDVGLIDTIINRISESSVLVEYRLLFEDKKNDAQKSHIAALIRSRGSNETDKVTLGDETVSIISVQAKDPDTDSFVEIENACDWMTEQLYCVHGSCKIGDEGVPHCQCEDGHGGDRCDAPLSQSGLIIIAVVVVAVILICIILAAVYRWRHQSIRKSSGWAYETDGRPRTPPKFWSSGYNVEAASHSGRRDTYTVRQ